MRGLDSDEVRILEGACEPLHSRGEPEHTDRPELCESLVRRRLIEWVDHPLAPDEFWTAVTTPLGRSALEIARAVRALEGGA